MAPLNERARRWAHRRAVRHVPPLGGRRSIAAVLAAVLATSLSVLLAGPAHAASVAWPVGTFGVTGADGTSLGTLVRTDAATATFGNLKQVPNPDYPGDSDDDYPFGQYNPADQSFLTWSSDDTTKRPTWWLKSWDGTQGVVESQTCTLTDPPFWTCGPDRQQLTIKVADAGQPVNDEAKDTLILMTTAYPDRHVVCGLGITNKGDDGEVEKLLDGVGMGKPGLYSMDKDKAAAMDKILGDKDQSGDFATDVYQPMEQAQQKAATGPMDVPVDIELKGDANEGFNGICLPRP